LAIALWFFVISSGRSGIILDVPVKFVNMPMGFEVVGAPKTISVGIEGQERLLKNLRQENISAVIDLSTSKTGKNLFHLSERNIKLPKTLVITSISPRTISLILEERLQKEVPVEPVIIGSPAEGFIIKEIKVLPEKVTIEGPRSVITRIHRVKTETIDITGINKTLYYNAYLDLTESNIKINTHEVKVNIKVQ
jgi:YbbR domain-containing protein